MINQLKKLINGNYFPFVKWVGGKRQLIEKNLMKYLPKEFDRYIEPFVGGGAMLCFIKPEHAIINDINEELIISYKTIKDNYLELMHKLDELKEKHSKNFYYEMRAKQYIKDVDIAARFIYLNKTCFNGLYRVNSKGIFNVPFNNKDKSSLNLYDLHNLENWNKYLNNNDVEILNENFDKVLDKAQQGDFVYCDPPYDYETDTIGFDSYNKDSFGQKNQILLAEKLKELNCKNVKWMLSNHNTKLINDLYKDFNIVCITSNRMINSNASKRVNTGKEVIVFNYEV